MLTNQHMWCRDENFIVFMYALQSIVKTLEWTMKSPRSNQAHVYFIFPWPALYVALVFFLICLIVKVQNIYLKIYLVLNSNFLQMYGKTC